MMKKISLLVFLFISVYTSLASSSSVSYIFPPQYSLFFNYFSNFRVKITESILHGDQIQQKFGISLWFKMHITNSGGSIFAIFPPETLINNIILGENFLSLSYSLENDSFNLESNAGEGFFYGSKLSLSYTPSSNWIFIGISAGFENKSLLLYYNDLVSESYARGLFLSETSIKPNSLLVFGAERGTMTKRIGDFRIYNNIYNEVSEWRSQCSLSCTAVSCASLFPSVDWGKCDQWCASEVESFIPAFDPVLYLDTPYLTISDKVYWMWDNMESLYDISTSVWNDYSITGWFQFQSCAGGGSTFL